jgi:Ca2+/Na+ antiporter
MRDNQNKIPWPVFAAASFVFVFCNLFSYFVFNHIPHIHDECAYVFQAKIFLTGRLYAPSPCAKEFFDFPHVINNGRWYSMYTPGYPFLLMLGLIFQAPWIINPLLASLAIFLFYFLGKEIYNRQIGILAALLGAASIWFLLMSSTMMSHTSSLFFACFFLLYLFRSLKNPSLANGALTGIGLGMAFLIRPYNAVLFSFPFLVYYAFHFFRDMRLKLKNAMAFALTTIAIISALLVYNQLTNGDPLKMGYIVHHGRSYAMIFGRPATLEYDYTPMFGTVQALDNLKALNSDLFGWPLSSFWALLPLFWLVKIESSDRKKDLLLAISFVFFLAGVYFFWGSFVFLGARMLFETVPFFLLLSARGIHELPRSLGLLFKRAKLERTKKVIFGVLIIFVSYGFIIRFPSWIWPKDTEWPFEILNKNFAYTTPNIHNTVKSLGVKNAVILMKFLYHPLDEFPNGYWGSGFAYNDPDLKTDIIYANDLGERNTEIFRCFSQRNFYLYLGTLEKGMLIPIQADNKKNIYGEPIGFFSQGKKFVGLIQKPQNFFKGYSPEFEDFLDHLYKENNFILVNVDSLFELGKQAKKNENFKQAAFYFEAALQLEKDPYVRSKLLNLLIPCHLKLGNIEEARKIEERIKKVHFNERKMYLIFPEKGF